MPILPAPQGDAADVLTPLILDALSGIQLGQDLIHIQLSRHVAHQVGRAISWAALAATLEATRRQSGAPGATADGGPTRRHHPGLHERRAGERRRSAFATSGLRVVR